MVPALRLVVGRTSRPRDGHQTDGWRGGRLLIGEGRVVLTTETNDHNESPPPTVRRLETGLSPFGAAHRKIDLFGDQPGLNAS
jgi:hypothetical protein